MRPKTDFGSSEHILSVLSDLNVHQISDLEDSYKSATSVVERLCELLNVKNSLLNRRALSCKCKNLIRARRVPLIKRTRVTKRPKCLSSSEWFFSK